MRILATLAAAAILFSAADASGQQGLGEAVAVIDVATASGQIGDRQLSPGAKIFVGDLVTTQATGEAQIVFSDGTRVLVGANASMTFEELRMSANATGSQFTMKLGEGAFRFISGRTPSKGYRIRTPDAIITPRGTALDIAVTDPVRTWLILLEGAVQLCDAAGNCVETEERCSVLRTDETNAAEVLAPGKAPSDEVGRYFPYLGGDAKLEPPFRVEDHGCAPEPRGGVAKFALERAGMRTPIKAAMGAVGAGAILCALACGNGGGGSPSTVQTGSGTN